MWYRGYFLLTVLFFTRIDYGLLTVTFSIQVDNRFTSYFDGVTNITGNNRNKVYTTTVPDDLRLVAIDAYDGGGDYFIEVKSGVISTNSPQYWKCIDYSKVEKKDNWYRIDYNDTVWPMAGNGSYSSNNRGIWARSRGSKILCRGKIDIDDCVSSPCNSGSCIDNLYHYTCHCPVGFTGSFCETDVEECASFPCVNGGTCEDRVNDFVCFCAPGFMGSNCSQQVKTVSSRAIPIAVGVAATICLGVIVFVVLFLMYNRRKNTRITRSQQAHGQRSSAARVKMPLYAQVKTEMKSAPRHSVPVCKTSNGSISDDDSSICDLSTLSYALTTTGGPVYELESKAFAGTVSGTEPPPLYAEVNKAAKRGRRQDGGEGQKKSPAKNFITNTIIDSDDKEEGSGAVDVDYVNLSKVIYANDTSAGKVRKCHPPTNDHSDFIYYNT